MNKATADQTFDRLTRKNTASGALSITELCDGIEAGYTMEMSLLDDAMLDMAEELSNRTDELRKGSRALAMLPQLVQSLQKCEAELFAQCGMDKPRHAAYITTAREVLAKVRDAGLI